MSTVISLLCCLCICLCSGHQVATDGEHSVSKGGGGYEQALMNLVLVLSDQLKQQSGELRHLGEKVTSLEEWKMNTKNRSSNEAFRGFVINPVVANAPIRFSTQLLRGQGDLNPHSGVYTVATPGVYLLGFQLYPSFSYDFIADLFINGAQGIRTRCYRHAYDTACGASAVFHLEKGDTVWVQSTAGGKYWEINHSYIFGVLVFPE